MKAVDLFAGWGGFSLGASAAGLDVVYAANHWQTAVDVHIRNHPSARHECQDLRQADWSRLPQYDVLLASPACQGHSDAGRPNEARWGLAHKKQHDADRQTAWAVVDCADVTGPSLIVVENVPAFRTWRLYPVWRMALEALGYSLQEHLLVASRHGHTPQRRERLFVVATRAAHATLSFPEHEEPAIGGHIDWAEGDWKPFSAASPWARKLLEAGRMKLGDRGLVQYVSRGGRVATHEPIRTVTTKDQWCAIKGRSYRSLSTREYARAMGFPDTFTWSAGIARTDVIKGLGNAVPPGLAATVIRASMAALAGKRAAA